jgi:tetratricopeptide (TPR) repeat protein
MNAGDRAMETGDVALALEHYRAAQNLNPDNVEMSFWTGVTLASDGRVDESVPFFRTAFNDRSNGLAPAEGGADWIELLRRLPEAGLFPDDHKLINRILEAAAPEAVSDRSSP